MLERFFPRRGRDSPFEDDADLEQPLTLRHRDVGFVIPEAYEMEDAPELPSSPFAELRESMRERTKLCDLTWDLMRDGSGIQELVETCPGDVITVLRNHAVVKLGTFQAYDSDVLKVFGQDGMLTRGHDMLRDPDWEENWRDDLKRRMSRRPKFVSVGWEEMVSLGAYAVNIKNVAERDERGSLLQLLMQKYSSGATSKKIWQFPAVRAVINYHWEHWAWRFLVITSLLYLCWIALFTAYIILYIESHVDASGIGKDRSWERAVSHVLNILSFAFMLPFAIEEYWTMVKQGRQWVSRINILDTCTILFQTVIFALNMMQWSVHKEIFGIILALQCIFLFSRLQIFSRVLNSGTYFFEVFLSVMYDARYLLSYVLLTGMSASLCLGAIYKMDTEFQKSENQMMFSNVRNSLITTFQIIFGSFDTSYIFDSHWPWVKIVFFFVFQVIMTVTVLNLLIAVMTDSYSKFAMDQHIRYNRGRAAAINELELIKIPSYFSADLHPYIHFLIVERKPRTTVKKEGGSLMTNSESRELEHKMKDMSEKLDALISLIQAKDRKGKFPLQELLHKS